MFTELEFHAPEEELRLSTSLEGKQAIVTGGASGIGRAVARALAAHGAQVAVADIAEGTDVSLPEDVDRFYSQVAEQGVEPQILICSAGVGIHERLAEGDPEKWARVLEVNLLGALRMIRAFLPGMLERQEGDIVLISSVAAARPYEWGGVYSASKAALDAAAEALRLETLPHIRITVVSPGMVNTAFFNRVVGLEHLPDSDSLEAEDVADAVIFAITRRRGVVVNHVVLRPASQTF
jgi:NADP-dependent 3-hydroxy acid dehydrogenase YdfG